MQQSRILGELEMTHSKYVNDVDTQKQTQKQDEQILNTLAQYARKSYIPAKKGKKQEIKIEDVKPMIKKHKIFYKSKIEDLSVSKLPNYNSVKVQNISQNNVSCFLCNPPSIQCFFMLQQEASRLTIYKKGSQQVLFSFNFNTIEAEVRKQQSSNEYFLLIANNLILKISHENERVLKNWYSQIDNVLDKSSGRKYHLRDIYEKNPQAFYQTSFCTQDQFTSNCQTGDILLFQDEHFFAKAQRFILNADYDHVAMIIRDKKYGILMFQANSMSGVCLTPWSCMIKYSWYKYIKRIVWRKLQNVERSKFFQGIIHQFVKQNLKSKYYISFDKLLSNQSYIGVKDEEKGFFCSQLIAKIYKDLQILTRDEKQKHYMPSNKIYPYHFSEKYDLKLEMGNLSKQYEIHFSEALLKNEYGEGFIN